MLKLLAKKLAQSDLAVNMIIAIWLTVFLEVISCIAKICVFALLESYHRVLWLYSRKHCSVSCRSHINFTVELNKNH